MDKFLEIEQGVLGVLIGSIAGSFALLQKIQFLKTEHFSEPEHRAIFQTIQDLAHKEGLDARPLLISVRLGEKDLDTVGGMGYLKTLEKKNSAIMNLKGYALEVVDRYKRRKLLELANKLQTEADEYGGGITANEILRDLQQSLQNIITESPAHEIKTSRQVTEMIVEGFKQKLNCYNTGIDVLNFAMGGGLYEAKAYCVAAKKKVGKTNLVSTISYNLNMAGVKHLFVAAEMSPQEIQQRNIARTIKRNSLAFLSKERESLDFQTRVAAAGMDDPGNTLFLHSPGIRFNDLRQSISLAVAKYGIKGFILDYFQLVGGMPPKQSKVEFFDEVAQWIAEVCRQEKIWALTTAQINQQDNIRWGEGIRLAFDQVYHLKPAEHLESHYFLEMMDTRYTPWFDVGTNEDPMLLLDNYGPYFRQKDVQF